jgi:hypothetical protein
MPLLVILDLYGLCLIGMNECTSLERICTKCKSIHPFSGGGGDGGGKGIAAAAAVFVYIYLMTL